MALDVSVASELAMNIRGKFLNDFIGSSEQGSDNLMLYQSFKVSYRFRMRWRQWRFFRADF